MPYQLSFDCEIAKLIRALHQDRPSEHVTVLVDGKPLPTHGRIK